MRLRRPTTISRSGLPHRSLDDLQLESYRELQPGVPFSLLPPYEWEETDDEWEEKQLIDAVKERRRRAATAKASAASPTR